MKAIRPTYSTYRPRRKHHYLRWATLALSLPLLASLLLILPLRWSAPVTTAFMLRDDSGRDPLLHRWATWADISSAMPLAVVAAEDQRFAEHFGLDLQSIQQSLDDAEQGQGLRGASTISQQLAKNLFLSPKRSFVRKGVEAYLSLVIEVCLPKRRILELYLNVIELGPGIYGVEAASRHFFAKPAAALSDSEAALLAAVLPNPIRLKANAPSDYVRERQRWIQRQMRRLQNEQWLTNLD